MRSAGLPSRRPLLLAFLALAALQATLAFVWVRPGPLSIDEVLHQWMTRSAAAGSPLAVLNGYGEMASRELATVKFMAAGEERLTVQYPALYAIVAAPAYALLGFRALFLLNALAFCGVLLFTWRIGRRLLGSAPAALTACGILTAGTYAWEYSMAAWPHMVTLLLQVAAFDLVLAALGRKDGSPLAALAAGLLAGLAVGFRRDAVFLLPVLALFLLYARPPRLRSLGALAAGAAAPLLLVAWLNALRWGIWSPLTYGRSEPGYRVVGLLGVAGLLGLAALARPGVRQRVFRSPPLVVLAGAVAVLAVFLLPGTRDRAYTAVEGVENLLFDLRGSYTNPDMYYWAVAYGGGLKKSLLQSLPWLPLLAIPVRAAWKAPERRAALALLVLPVLVYAGVPALLDRHGGMSLNLRYLIPALPFLSLLAAWALGDVARAAGRDAPDPADSSRPADSPDPSASTVDIDPAGVAPFMPRPAAAVAAGMALAAGAWLLLRPRDFVARADEGAVLDAPLLIALLVALAVGAWLWRGGAVPGRDAASPDAVAPGPPEAPGRSREARVLLGATALALTWSACVAFDYDARWSRQVRAENLARSVAVAERVPEDALLFAEVADWHGTVPELRDGVVVAFPWVDGYRDMGPLARHHLARGRPVYAALTPPTWNAAREAGALEGLDWREVGSVDPAVTVRELVREPEPSVAPVR